MVHIPKRPYIYKFNINNRNMAKEDKNNDAILTYLDVHILKILYDDGKQIKKELIQKTNSCNRHIKSSLEYLKSCHLIKMECGANKDGHRCFLIKEERPFIKRVIDKFS